MVAMNLAYFGMEGLASDLERIPLEYLDHALTWLRLQPYVDPGRVGLLGGSKGGELPLLFASLHPEVRAVAALVPSGIVFQSTARGFPDSSSWSYHGRELPFVRYGKIARPPTVADFYRAGLREATPEQLEAATIPVELHSRPHPAAQRQSGHALAVERASGARRREAAEQGLHLRGGARSLRGRRPPHRLRPRGRHEVGRHTGRNAQGHGRQQAADRGVLGERTTGGVSRSAAEGPLSRRSF